ncbi:GNAT family N-acetyltransferase [Marivirga sp. S37H4]|uniref:GNAT family N-acetyltransferase n=1 Tax=Marivirga aurantiaca TaxID=2802615 RepID=A0A934WWA8_9BACT|nr:GNAT family N-acetyltransferase [Marivirga aurantiaca]MBK6264020.1 GNAT family N-acetyltransferase [Marivirga aurantiaca]
MNTINSYTLAIKKAHTITQAIIDFMLLADPDIDKVQEYIDKATIYIAIYKGETVGCYALLDLAQNEWEIKNIAVAENYQGKGIGTLLLHDAFKKAKSNHIKELTICTGNSSLRQLTLYRKLGFKIVATETDYFVRHYKEPIMENGIQYRSLIILKKFL